MSWLSEIAERSRPAAEVVPLEGTALLTTLALAAAAVAIRPLWRVLRVAITLVHELGHAFVGILAGRRFTGFVVRGDMSGHAVTVGRSRGAGRIATTWAGYPMPAFIGAAMVVLAEYGYAAPLLTAILLLLMVATIRIRSALTLLVMLLALSATAYLWWDRDDTVQTHVLVGVGIVLIVGAWRHLGAVLPRGAGDRGSDPAVLAQLTWLPRTAWAVTFVIAIALATLAAGMTISAGLGLR